MITGELVAIFRRGDGTLAAVKISARPGPRLKIDGLGFAILSSTASPSQRSMRRALPAEH